MGDFFQFVNSFYLKHITKGKHGVDCLNHNSCLCVCVYRESLYRDVEGLKYTVDPPFFAISFKSQTIE